MRKLSLLGAIVVSAVFYSGFTATGTDTTFDLSLSTNGTTKTLYDSAAVSKQWSQGVTASSTAVDIGSTGILTSPALSNAYDSLGALALDDATTLVVFGGASTDGADAADGTLTNWHDFSGLEAVSQATHATDFTAKLAGLTGGAATGITLIVGGTARDVAVAGTTTALKTFVLGTNAAGNALSLESLTQAATAGSVNVVADAGNASVTVGALDLGAATPRPKSQVRTAAPANRRS